MKDLAQRLHNAGFVLFSEKSYDAKRCAQINLSGRTHYAEDDTLRFFRGRILKCSILDNGTILGIVESCSADMHHSARAYRPVFCNLNGEVISRCTLDDAFKTSATAHKEFWRIANALDARAECNRMLESMATRAELQAAEYRAILTGGQS